MLALPSKHICYIGTTLELHRPTQAHVAPPLMSGGALASSLFCLPVPPPGPGGWGGGWSCVGRVEDNLHFYWKLPRRRRAARLMSTDYSVIAVLQNKMTSTLFTDGINHSLAELEIPAESLYAVLGGGVAGPQPPIADASK